MYVVGIHTASKRTILHIDVVKVFDLKIGQVLPSLRQNNTIVYLASHPFVGYVAFGRLFGEMIELT